MAVKSVSAAASAQTSNALGAPAAGGSALGALAALTTGTAAGGATSPTAANGNAAPPVGGNPLNFLQLLTQSNANLLGLKPGDARSAATDVKSPAAAAGNKAANTDPTQTDPDAINAALQFVSQLMASPAAPAPVVTNGGPASEAASTAAAAPSLGAAAAAASAAAGTKPAADKTPPAGSADDDFSMQSFVSLLLQDTSSGPATAQPPELAPEPGQYQNADQGAASASAATADTSGAATNPAVNPHLGVGSHFQGPQNPTAPQADVKSPVGTSAWAEELGGKITWMAKQGIGSASLSLSPEHLGPVEVHISVQDGATSVMFGAAQPDTRSALEHALPRLREMFANQGLTLADAGVSRESPKQQNRFGQAASVTALSAISDDGVASVSSPVHMHLGLLDTYA